MYVDSNTIIVAGGVLSAVMAFGGLMWGFFKWVNKQNNQDKEIAEIKANCKNEIKAVKEHFEKEIKALRDLHNQDQQSMQEEQTLVIYGLLACLKGLAEQGCDGPVSEAIDHIEKHINKKAHKQV